MNALLPPESVRFYETGELGDFTALTYSTRTQPVMCITIGCLMLALYVYVYTLCLTMLSHSLQVHARFITRGDIVNLTTLNDGYLGSRNDEERSEMRYVV